MTIVPVEKVGGIVLCGGKSKRMGRSKASLLFGTETMLVRVVRVLQQVVSPIAVVAAPGQEIPSLPDHVLVARDEQEGLGPLGGLVVGLSVLRGQVEAAYVSSCDVPLLKPQFVRYMVEALKSYDLAIPRDGKYHHPLAAVYRSSLENRVRSLIAAERMRPIYLVEECDSCEVDVQKLRSVDPGLQSLRNTNTLEDYEAALSEAGFSVPNPID